MLLKEIYVFIVALVFLLLSVAAQLPVELNGTVTGLPDPYDCGFIGDHRLGCLEAFISLPFSTRPQHPTSIIITTTTTTTTAEPVTTTIMIGSVELTRSTATNSGSGDASTAFSPTSSRGLCYFAEEDILTPCSVQVPTSSPSASKSSSGTRNVHNPLAFIYRVFSRQYIDNHNNTMNIKEDKEGSGFNAGGWTNTHVTLLAIGTIAVLSGGIGSIIYWFLNRRYRNKAANNRNEIPMRPVDVRGRRV